MQPDPLRRTNGHGHTGIFQHENRATFMGHSEYNSQFTGKLV